MGAERQTYSSFLQAHGGENVKHKRLYAVLIVLAALDLITTWYAFSLGIGEGNPLIAPIAQLPEAMIVVKCFGLLCIGILAEWTDGLREGAGKYGIAAACIVWYSAIVWNIAYVSGAMLTI